jgi:hypothetical protein
MLVNRSTIAVSRVVICANLSSVQAAAELLGVIQDRPEAQDAFAFGVPLQRQQSEVDLEDGQVPPRFLDRDCLSRR